MTKKTKTELMRQFGSKVLERAQPDDPSMSPSVRVLGILREFAPQADCGDSRVLELFCKKIVEIDISHWEPVFAGLLYDGADPGRAMADTLEILMKPENQA